MAFRLDNLINALFGINTEPDTGSDLDKTGRVVSGSRRPTLRRFAGDVAWLEYPGQFAHSLWRSQEITLFMRHMDKLRPPVLDFGCGDGSFASVLFEHVDYGVDVDGLALEVAKQYDLYGRLICCDGAAIGLESESVQSVFSNSVLEHVDQLHDALAEIFRLLKPGGVFMFAVPVSHFTAHMARFFGESEAGRINRAFYHRHLCSPEEWKDKLGYIGFDDVKVIQYQPDWFTMWYRAAGTRAINTLHRCGLLNNGWYRAWVVKMVERSVSDTKEGSNAFIIARRAGGT